MGRLFQTVPFVRSISYDNNTSWNVVAGCTLRTEFEENRQSTVIAPERGEFRVPRRYGEERCRAAPLVSDAGKKLTLTSLVQEFVSRVSRPGLTWPRVVISKGSAHERRSSSHRDFDSLNEYLHPAACLVTSLVVVGRSGRRATISFARVVFE